MRFSSGGDHDRGRRLFDGVTAEGTASADLAYKVIGDGCGIGPTSRTHGADAMPSNDCDAGPADPFAVLGLPRAFPVDRAALDKARLRRTASLHPDRASEPTEAAAELARVNEAYLALADEESAAKALLETLGGPSATEVKDLPDNMLMEMLDIRERMDEAAATGDPALKAELQAWADERRVEFLERLTRAFAELGDLPSDEGLRDIRVQLNGWRYVERMIEQLDERDAM